MLDVDMHEAQVVVLEGALAFGGLGCWWLGPAVQPFGLEDAPDARHRGNAAGDCGLIEGWPASLLGRPPALGPAPWLNTRTEMDHTRAPGNREAAAEIARLIKPDPPAWLVNAIEIVALPRLRKEIAGFKAYPKRKELRPKNEATVKAIETLTANITDKGVWSQIVANSPEGDISKRRLERVADVVLNDMPHVLTALTKAMDNVTEGKGGRGAALHPKAPRPATVCAAFVTIVWVEAHRGEVPGPYDKAVWTACAALWRAAGGSRLDRAATTLPDEAAGIDDDAT